MRPGKKEIENKDNAKLKSTYDAAHNDDSVVMNAKTVRQNKRARNKSSSAAELEMNKVEKYRDQGVIDEAVNKSNVYDKSVQDRADTKDWSDRKRARVENKQGIELGNKDVHYTKGALESEGFEVSKDGSTVSNPDNLDFKLPTGKQTTNIDKDNFRNTYTIGGKYKGTRKRLPGGFGQKPTPTSKEKDGDYSVSQQDSSASTFSLQNRKTQKDYVKMWKGGRTNPMEAANEGTKKSAKKLHKRDVYTKKGREKLNKYYLHHSASSGEVNTQNTTDTTYQGENKTDQRQNKTTIKTGRHPGGPNN